MSAPRFPPGLGAQKCGTGWLHVCLASHPECGTGFTEEHHVLDAHSVPALRRCRGSVLDGHAQLAAKARTPGRQEKEIRFPLRKWFVEDLSSCSDDFAGLAPDALDRLDREMPARGLGFVVALFPTDPLHRIVSAVRMARRNDLAVETRREEDASEAFERPEMEMRSDHFGALRSIDAAGMRERSVESLYEERFTEDRSEGARNSVGISRIDAGLGSRGNILTERAEQGGATCPLIVAPCAALYRAVMEWFGIRKVVEAWPSATRYPGITA